MCCQYRCVLYFPLFSLYQTRVVHIAPIRSAWIKTAVLLYELRCSRDELCVLSRMKSRMKPDDNLVFLPSPASRAILVGEESSCCFTGTAKRRNTLHKIFPIMMAQRRSLVVTFSTIPLIVYDRIKLKCGIGFSAAGDHDVAINAVALSSARPLLCTPACMGHGKTQCCGWTWYIDKATRRV